MDDGDEGELVGFLNFWCSLLLLSFISSFILISYPIHFNFSLSVPWMVSHTRLDSRTTELVLEN